MDGAISSLDALEEVTGSGNLKGEILFDSGFRHAADALKAIALGASGILIGRPYAYALSVDERRERARITLTKDAWDYLEGGAGEEDTVHENSP